VTINSTGGVSLGTSRIGGYLDVSAGGNVSQGGGWIVGNDLWVATSSGNITLDKKNTIPGKVSLVGATNSDIYLYASNIFVNTATAPSSATTQTGILGAHVTLQADSNAAFVSNAGVVKATETAAGTAALTIKANGAIGSSATVAFVVETKGLLVVEGSSIGDGIINLKGDDAFQPKYDGSGDPSKRTVLYNGQQAENAQLTGALDAAYLDIRNATTEVRESGFAKENASKVLRRGVVTSAGPGQPAVDDSTGMAGAEECEGGFADGSLSCQ
jgi:hypothetical protein